MMKPCKLNARAAFSFEKMAKKIVDCIILFNERGLKISDFSLTKWEKKKKKKQKNYEGKKLPRALEYRVVLQDFCIFHRNFFASKYKVTEKKNNNNNKKKLYPGKRKKC